MLETLNSDFRTIRRGAVMKNDKIKEFWAWFARNSERLKNAEREMRIGNELSDQLRHIHQPEGYEGTGPGLSFDFGPRREGKYEFIVSAGGIAPAFRLARELVALAPEIPGWRFSALIPPKNIEALLLEAQMKPEDIWYQAQPENAKVNVTLFIRNLPPEKEHDLLETKHFLIYALGEQTFATRIARFDCHILPSNPAECGLKPFRELPEEIGKSAAG